MPVQQPIVKPPPRAILLSVTRVIVSATVLGVIYYEVPFERSTWESVLVLAIGLSCLFALVGWQVRSIGRSRYPGLRAVEALAVSIPLFLILFAGTYFDLEYRSPGTFTQTMTRTDAIYFTVTVFGTVGFGDITAKSEAARILVTAQMLVDLVILGVGARLILGAVQRAQRSRYGETVE